MSPADRTTCVYECPFTKDQHRERATGHVFTPRAADSLSEAIDTLDAAAFSVHAYHAPNESWMLCQHERCLRIGAALVTLRASE